MTPYRASCPPAESKRRRAVPRWLRHVRPLGIATAAFGGAHLRHSVRVSIVAFAVGLVIMVLSALAERE